MWALWKFSVLSSQRSVSLKLFYKVCLYINFSFKKLSHSRLTTVSYFGVKRLVSGYHRSHPLGVKKPRQGTYVYLWLTHVDVWQKPTKFCKAIILQLKKLI